MDCITNLTDKELYLETQCVTEFCTYLYDLIYGKESFSHSYTIRGCVRKNKDWYEHNKNNTIWKIDSLKEAYEQYYWGGCLQNSTDDLKGYSNLLVKDNVRSNTSNQYHWLIRALSSNITSKDLITFRTTNHILKIFSDLGDDGLKEECIEIVNKFVDFDKTISLNVVPLPNDIDRKEKQVLYGALMILQWGGVLNKGSIEWLFSRYKNGDLLKCIEDAHTRLTGDTLNCMEAFTTGGRRTNYLLMNSGMTKIYSAHKSGSIIYDGRVGAALGLLVKQYLIQNVIKEVPDELNFHWGADMGNDGRRNPCDDTYTFSKLGGDSYQHALQNQRANWILDTVIKKAKGENSSPWNVPKGLGMLRAIEAALFMIGYSVRG